MRENEYLDIIYNTLTHPGYLGDDCAFLQEYGLYITQDTLVEDVHFSLKTTTPYELGIKSVSANLSDLAASMAKPTYITVSLSLPQKFESTDYDTKYFVENFYRGINDCCKKYRVKVVGGDLTKSEKVFISIVAIGKKRTNIHVSRSYATPGDYILTTGSHGDSAGCLELLQAGKTEPQSLIKKHLTPIPRLDSSRKLSKTASSAFAMMDTSDGLGDGLYKMAEASNVTMLIDFERIPISDELKQAFPNDYIGKVLWGGEDFELLLCINPDTAKALAQGGFTIIGIVKERIENAPVVIKGGDSKLIIDEKMYSKFVYKHFEEN